MSINSVGGGSIPADLQPLNHNEQAQNEAFSRILTSDKNPNQKTEELIRLVLAFNTQNTQLAKQLGQLISGGGIPAEVVASVVSQLSPQQILQFQKLVPLNTTQNKSNTTQSTARTEAPAPLPETPKTSGPTLEPPKPDTSTTGSALAHVLTAIGGISSNATLSIFALIIIKKIQEQVRDTNLLRGQLQAELAFEDKRAQAETIQKEALTNAISAAAGLAFSVINFSSTSNQFKQQKQIHADAKLNRSEINTNEKLLQNVEPGLSNDIKAQQNKEREIIDQLGNSYDPDFQSVELTRYNQAKAQSEEAFSGSEAYRTKVRDDLGPDATDKDIDDAINTRRNEAALELNDARVAYYGGVDNRTGATQPDLLVSKQKQLDQLRANNAPQDTIEQAETELSHLKLERGQQERNKLSSDLSAIKDKRNDLTEIGKDLDLKLNLLQQQTQLRVSLSQGINTAISTGFGALSSVYRSEGVLLEADAQLQQYYAQQLKGFEQSAAAQASDLRNLIGQIFASIDGAVKNLQRIRG